MTQILVRISNPLEAERIESSLTQAGFGLVLDRGPETDGFSPSELAETVADTGPELVIMDLITHDARSVKAMQLCLNRSPETRFLFVLDREVEPSHLVMALNEGASAFLTSPVKNEALLNYVNRTLESRRKNLDYAARVRQCEEIIQQEKSCALEQASEISKFQRKLRHFHRLVNFLLTERNPKGRPWKIMLVSDSAFQVDRFRQSLEHLNFEVVSASDGPSALDLAQKEHPRIVISDLEMPGLNGLELCQAFKNDDRLAPNYFIICTANTDRIDDVMRPENKVDDCIIKPGQTRDFEEFTARIALGLLH